MRPSTAWEIQRRVIDKELSIPNNSVKINKSLNSYRKLIHYFETLWHFVRDKYFKQSPGQYIKKMEDAIASIQKDINELPVYSEDETKNKTIPHKLDNINRKAIELEMRLNFIQTEDMRAENAEKIIKQISRDDDDERMNDIQEAKKVSASLRNIIQNYAKYYSNQKGLLSKLGDQIKEYTGYICIRIEKETIDLSDRQRIRNYIHNLLNRSDIKKEMLLSNTTNNIADIIIKPIDKKRDEALNAIFEQQDYNSFKKDDEIKFPDILTESKINLLELDKINDIITSISKDSEIY